MHEIPLWMVPSFYGDVRLSTLDAKRCRVTVERATVKEQEALRKVATLALRRKWMTGDASRLLSGQTELSAPIDKVAAAIAKALKPDRKLISAVTFAGGQIEEIATSNFEDDGKEPAVPRTTPYRESTPPEGKKIEVPKTEATPKAATTVAAPVIGCPAPDFPSAELKARQVLTMFLTPEQREDFARYNRFISVGAETGHRYMITSRHARTRLPRSFRSLRDLDEERDLCVHDWTVPAAEEMLALHLCVSLPGREGYVRSIPDDGLVHA